MPYVEKVTETPGYIVVEKYYSTKIGVPEKVRAKRTEKTPRDVQALNEKRSQENLNYLIDCNFDRNDMHVVLTYRREERPVPEQAKQDLQKFLRKARALYKKQNKILKYIAVTEYQNTAIHHHVIMTGIDARQLQDIWPYGMLRPTYLYASEEHEALSAYLIKETKKTFMFPDSSQRLRYCCSKNLKKPKITKHIVSAKTFSNNPKARSGYVLDKNSVIAIDHNDFNGYPYQKYKLYRIGDKNVKANVQSRRC